MNLDMDMSDRKVSLVGGAGFVGHHLAVGLKNAGADVEVIDSLQVNNVLQFSAAAPNTFEAWARQVLDQRLAILREHDIPFVLQDARDYHGLSRVLSKKKPDTVVQLAAVSHAGRANKDPYHTFDHSLRTLENALDYSRDNVEHFIYFSSSMAYGTFQTPSITEEHPLNPLGIYGALKASGELMVRSYGQVFDLPFNIIRPSALYGPRCVSRRVSQQFIENAMQGKKLQIFGDGEERLDFTFVDDVVQGVARMMDQGADGEAYNLTYGSSRSLNDLAEILRERFPNLEVDYVPRDDLMPIRGTLDVTKAKKNLGYAPAYPLEEGYHRYIDWYQQSAPKPSW